MESPKESFLLLKSPELRVGMFVHIELGWMDHPFALNRFRIASDQQLSDIKDLDLKQVRVVPSRSDADLFTPALLSALSVNLDAKQPENESVALVSENSLMLALQKANLARCDKSYTQATQQWKKIMADVMVNPLEARLQCNHMLSAFLEETSVQQDTHIRLLSEVAGESFVLHALNVTVMALLLGRALKFTLSELEDVGMAALLHDMGKQKLPDRIRLGINLSAAQAIVARSHVQESLQMARAMGLSAGVLSIIAQHHELADGSGYPQGLTAPNMTRGAQVVSLVNLYDNLNNPSSSMLSLTPHEAISILFAQRKAQFEAHTLQAFVQLMGVYPPGSLVQLNDDRYAIVVSANATRPHKPSVLVHDATTPIEQAIILDLQKMPLLTVRRSLHPRNLPPDTLAYLSPRKRVSYFFDNSSASDAVKGGVL